MRNRREFLYGAGAAAILPTMLPAVVARSAAELSADAWQRAADIVHNVRAPTFPNRIFDVTHFGAKAGAALNDVGQVGRAAITCDFNDEEGANGAFTPQLRNVVVERLRVKKAVRVLDSQGVPKAPVNDITLRDCAFDGVTQPSIVKYTKTINLEGVRVNGAAVREI